MQRTVITLSQKLIQLMMLPEQYLGKQAEIRLCDSTFNKSKDQEMGFKALKLDTKKFKFNREEANER